MAEKKLTAQQKRDREVASLIAGIQKEYEDKIAEMREIHRIENDKMNSENYIFGYEQGFKAAEATYKAQNVIDRLLKKAL